MKRYPKGSAWRRGHWDKWGFWRKVLHVISVIAGIITLIAMFLAFAYIMLIYFGILGFILQARDFILLEIMHSIFG